MRDSLAYKKDFVTGEVIEVMKKKPINNIKGLTKIELFDNVTDKKVEEIFSENMVTGVHDNIAKYLMMQAIPADYSFYMMTSGVQYGLGSSVNNYSLANGKWASSLFGIGGPGTGDMPYIMNPFSYLLLTDDSTAEYANEAFAKGNVIGWSDRYSNTTASDAKRGTWNSGESYVRNGQMHMVYDWATNAGNGTFNSIVWNQSLALNGFYPAPYKRLRLVAPVGYKFNSIARGGFVRQSNGYFYVSVIHTTDNTKRGIVGYQIDETNQTATQMDFIPLTVTSGYYINGFAFHESTNSVYTIQFNTTSSSFIVKYPITGGSSVNLPNATSNLQINGTGSFVWNQNMFIFGEKLLYCDGTNNGTLTLRNLSDFSIISTTNIFGNISLSAGYTIGVTSINGNLVEFSYGGSLFTLDLSTNTFNFNPYTIKPFPLNTVQSSQVSSTSDYLFNMRKESDGQYTLIRNGWDNQIEGTDNVTYLIYHRYGPLGARNLLPAPVTKDATKTMKITYDFFFNI